MYCKTKATYLPTYLPTTTIITIITIITITATTTTTTISTISTTTRGWNKSPEMGVCLCYEEQIDGLCICVYLCVFVCICVFVCLCVFVYLCVCVFMCVCVFVCVCVCYVCLLRCVQYSMFYHHIVDCNGFHSSQRIAHLVCVCVCVCTYTIHSYLLPYISH